VGVVSIATARDPVSIQELSGCPETLLPDVRLELQPGLRFLHTPWPVDELFALYLSDESPAQFIVTEAPRFIEIRGSRGAFAFGRLASGGYAFRRALADGEPLGTAAASAIERHGAFDVTTALATLFADGLVAAIINPAGR
jgi:hypothetical protein